MISHDEAEEERLTTTTASGARIYLYPADVTGTFRRWRNIIYDILLVIFLILPWVRIKGEPVLLFDLPNRKFHIFGLSFWGHDAPILFFILFIAVISILLMTALFGRLWCGWGCPQTVFIDRIYRRLEQWIEGNAASRMRLAKGPWTVDKVRKRGLKWILYIAASLVIAHSFLAYFVGVDHLKEMMSHTPSENPKPFLVMLFMTGLVLFDFGWFREQFCLIACPYGRFQSVLMDENSLIVTYDQKRGEPRKGSPDIVSSLGDCVNCKRCLQVCPTGIDIRKGVQMECIACTACIDACDTVMEKLKRPKGLIRYDTEQGLENQPTKWMRPRVIIYSVLLFMALSGLTFVLANRKLLKVNIVRPQSNPYQVISDGESVINHFKLNLRNQYDFPIFISFGLPPEFNNEDDVKVTVPVSPLKIDLQSSNRSDMFISFNRSLLNSQNRSIPVVFSIMKDSKAKEFINALTSEVPLIGPGMSSTNY